MKTISAIAGLLFVTAIASAASFKPSLPLDVTFSAHLSKPISGEPIKNSIARSLLKTSNGYYYTFNLYCEKSFAHCDLWIHSISDDYCNGKGSPPNQDASGFSYNYLSNVAVKNIGNELSFEFQNVLTYNAILIKLTANPTHLTNFDQSIVTNVSGTASTLHTAIGVPTQSFYRKLDKRVLCKLGFFPVGK